ncbi:preprotein translocase subunit SecG [Prevotella intermedia]|nr:preprotein translocase subunit SecG [Prevotella intermedia]
MMNKLYKIFSSCCLCSHLFLIVNVLLMKKEKYYILLFVSNSILKSNMMRG